MTKPRHVLPPDEAAELERRFQLRGQMHIVLQELGTPAPDWQRIAAVLRAAVATIEAAQ